MPKHKVAKVNFVSFLAELENDDQSIQHYQRALQKINLSSTAFRQLTEDEQFGVLVSRFGFSEFSRIHNAIQASSISSLFDPNILSETLQADLELCQILVLATSPTATPSLSDPLSLPSSSTSSSVCSSSSLPTSSSSVSPSSLVCSSSRHPVDLFLAPPYSFCVICQSELTKNHHSVEVKVLTLTGSKRGRKTILRCRKCSLVYRYNCYGNAQSSFKLYEKSRPLVEASDTLYVDRQLFELQCSLANHSWVSFVGFAESFNDAFGLSRQAGVSAKNISSAFYNGEMENELRELGRLDMFGLMKVDADREKIMKQVESLRRKKPYAHTICHPNCAAKGCGRVFVADGIWKLSFPHCMHKCQNKVSGIPVPSLPDVCTNSPVRGKAFCAEHCEHAAKSEIPTGLRDFLKHCDVNKTDPSATGQYTSTESQSGDEIDGNCSLESDTNCNEQTVHQVGEVLSKLEPVPSTGESVVDAQGTTNFLDEHIAIMPTMMTECVEELPSTCKKDVGARKRLQKWSRGHLFIVRAGGHIESWQTLYKSESPSQVFLILVSWLFSLLRTVPQTSWSNLAIVYDNMCHLDNMIVARKPLPLAWPWSHMWLSPHKCVDRLHIRNHTDKLCKTKYHPSDHLAETDNTISAEQTFVWLSRFKKILCAMPKVHHMFYLHRMVVRRNRYTAYCYHVGYNPVLPVVKSTKTT